MKKLGDEMHGTEQLKTNFMLHPVLLKIVVFTGQQ